MMHVKKNLGLDGVRGCTADRYMLTGISEVFDEVYFLGNLRIIRESQMV